MLTDFPKIILDLMLVMLQTYAILKTFLQKSKNQLIVGVKLSLSILASWVSFTAILKN